MPGESQRRAARRSTSTATVGSISPASDPRRRTSSSTETARPDTHARIEELAAGHGVSVRKEEGTVLEARALTKTYGRVRGVRGVSFRLNAGEVTGYLGPNGAGKSTTVKILTGLVPPSSGHVLVDGRDVRDDLIGYKRTVGYVPEEPHLYP